MIDCIARIRFAATDKALRADARAIWQTVARDLFEDHPREGLRISDAGQCVRALWNEIHVAPKVFTPEVQLDNLDNGTLIGCWRMCLLTASLEAEGYIVDLEPEVTHDGVPGHIDLLFSHSEISRRTERGVVEHKLTMWPRTLTVPDVRAPYQVLQAAKYAEAKRVEDFCIITSGPASQDKMREDWYRTEDWQLDVAVEYERLSLALKDREPVEDAKEPWRCKGCPVIACVRNPQAPIATKLAASLL